MRKPSARPDAALLIELFCSDMAELIVRAPLLMMEVAAAKRAVLLKPTPDECPPAMMLLLRQRYARRQMPAFTMNHYFQSPAKLLFIFS